MHRIRAKVPDVIDSAELGLGEWPGSWGGKASLLRAPGTWKQYTVQCVDGEAETVRPGPRRVTVRVISICKASFYCSFIIAVRLTILLRQTAKVIIGWCDGPRRVHAVFDRARFDQNGILQVPDSCQDGCNSRFLIFYEKYECYWHELLWLSWKHAPLLERGNWRRSEIGCW
jgi:hypothetical protein